MESIKGLTLITDFITDKEEKELIKYINQNDWDNKIKRRVQHYGHVFEYSTKKVNIQKYSIFPIWLEPVISKIKKYEKLRHFAPDQCTINEYKPGIGIAHHIDTHSSFSNTIISLSLQNNIIMSFLDKTRDSEKIEILLPNKSLLILQDDSRYKFSHGISYRKTDKIDDKIYKRELRISITLREILLSECRCKWKNLCDSQDGKLEKTRL